MEMGLGTTLGGIWHAEFLLPSTFFFWAGKQKGSVYGKYGSALKKNPLPCSVILICQVSQNDVSHAGPNTYIVLPLVCFPMAYPSKSVHTKFLSA